jgi:hypothetical protein
MSDLTSGLDLCGWSAVRVIDREMPRRRLYAPGPDTGGESHVD